VELNILQKNKINKQENKIKNVCEKIKTKKQKNKKTKKIFFCRDSKNT